MPITSSKMQSRLQIQSNIISFRPCSQSKNIKYCGRDPQKSVSPVDTMIINVFTFRFKQNNKRMQFSQIDAHQRALLNRGTPSLISAGTQVSSILYGSSNTHSHHYIDGKPYSQADSSRSVPERLLGGGPQGPRAGKAQEAARNRKEEGRAAGKRLQAVGCSRKRHSGGREEEAEGY